ncbi:uncharacterized protein EI97DRAFT_312955 [Westerdykella ornata]|uniref:Phosphoglycerate mutase-like protein n=1 Tax=Westerdykella ornata TaxID=318751 RepID=A0A6A6JKM1_WESOR|nr:uncharacterized protein EI97DRAFT_312955 [Westerdykella ornata]KAF2277200.1 hypothetical protein EI97DRAFT_312955 [Westerdykella ornata]
MGKGPAVVFIARHGSRLDAEDRTWHLTSPTPYDPPLTYGGWTQGKALGLRIAALLHARETDESSGSANRAAGGGDISHPDTAAPKPRRKHRIVIHSSPYLRCVQTSIAIAAGISQFQPPVTAPTLRSPHPGERKRVVTHRHTPTGDREVSPKPRIGPEKILLRIDAFLGEWLSEEYFQDITPPPQSTLMVTSAKAGLMRREDYVEVPQSTNSNQGHFPGGWKKSTTSPTSPVDGSRSRTTDGTFPTMGSLAQALQHRERASSQGSASGHPARPGSRAAGHKPPPHIYDPPTPSYALKPSEPIPRGYVSHAREACVQVDYQWDSMRPPQEWGDGGEYADEWSTMHKRFRKGLAGMMSWYKEHGIKNPYISSGVERDSSNGQPNGSISSPHSADPQEEEEDLVLVIVTHGAGCNALLGAITNQPVLMDVLVASLSMAVRRDEPLRPPETAPPLPTRRSSVIDVGMSDTYELKILASTDHYQPGVDPSELPKAQSPPVLGSRPSLDSRRRFTPDNPNNSILFVEPWKPVNSSLGSMRRRGSSESSSRSLASPNVKPLASPTAGLWGAPLPSIAQESDGRRSPGFDILPNFDEYKMPSKSTATTGSATTPTSANDDVADGEKENNDQKTERKGSIAAVPGGGLERHSSTASTRSLGLWEPKSSPTAGKSLWGPPRKDKDELAERAHGWKRRWTMTGREE